MFSILNYALSWSITSSGNKFCLTKRTRLIKALDNRFYVKFMQLEIGLLMPYVQICAVTVDVSLTLLNTLLRTLSNCCEKYRAINLLNGGSNYKDHLIICSIAQSCFPRFLFE